MTDVMDLVVRIDGSVQECNIDEFERSAMAILDGIKTDLQTDDDFAEADRVAKDCKQVEVRIQSAKQQAMHNIEDISKLFTVMDKLADKFRESRLNLEKKVRKEKAERRGEIIEGARAKITSAMVAYPVSDISQAEVSGALNNAVKGKRSLDKMREAICGVVDHYLEALGDAIVLYRENVGVILEAEEEYPGLFHDKGTVARKPVEEVKAIIESRINDFKLKQIEKKRAEEERARREAEEKSAEKEEVPQQQPSEPLPPEPQQPAVDNSGAFPMPGRSFPVPDEVTTFSVAFRGPRELAAQTMRSIQAMQGVESVSVISN